MKKIVAFISLLFTFLTGEAQTPVVVHNDTASGKIINDTVRHRVFLIGDAGDLAGDGHPVIDWIKSNVDMDDPKNTVIYLGDNIYDLGLPPEGDPQYPYYRRVIDHQISLVRGKKSRAFFVMGNHDWKNGKQGGWLQAVNQIDYINSQELPNVEATPRDGCPGPIEVEVDSLVVVVLIDTQWFLHVHDKPGPGSSCAAKTIDEFSVMLEEIMSSHPNQLVVLAMHHPLYTVGVHGGGGYTLRQHIFPLADAVKGLYIPLPVLGSVYPIARGIFGNIQDVNHPLYRTMAKTIEDVVKKYNNYVFVAGHDHSLQLLLKPKDSSYYIVSGSGAKTTRIARRKNDNVLFAQVQPGFTTMEISESGKVDVKFYNIFSKDFSSPVYASHIKTIRQQDPIQQSDSIGPLPEYVTVPANPKLEGSGLGRLFIGKNYRKEWTQPINVPVLNLETWMGGLEPERQGGGKQTKSLRLEDSTGKTWILRSVEKYPEAAIPPDLRRTFAKDLVEQGISASYPYGSLSYGTFAKAAGLPIIQRNIVYIPDDPNLRRFRNTFSNMMAILEEREPMGTGKTYNTDELVLRLAKDNDDHVIQKSVLQARLLDNFIMDFDRHEDQWRWSTKDTGKGKLYEIIPRDHDQIFYTNQGILPKLVSKPWMIPELQGFEAKAKNINTFNRPARNFDRFFLTELSEQEWTSQIDSFLLQMTDEVIEEALQKQPREIQGFAAKDIINTLKERRSYFKDEMLSYYKFLAKDVNVVGSNLHEQFTVTKNNDGSVRVVVNKITNKGEISSTIYDRTFDPKVTEVIQLYGLSGDDVFIVQGGDSPIKIRIIGGPGEDEFKNEGTGGKVLVYDASFEKNSFTGNPGLKDKTSADPNVNRYNRLGYKYDLFIPGLSLAYNVDDGLFLGLKAEVIKQGFRKEPYRTRHIITGNHALRTSSFRFRYQGEFIKVFGYHDLVLNGDFRAPVNVTNFFGLGNETVFDKDKPGNERYYRVRYNMINGSVLLRRQLQSWMQVFYGPSFQSFRVEYGKNQNFYVGETTTNGLDSATLYKTRASAGALFKLIINSRNSPVLPTRGTLLEMNLQPLVGLNSYSNTQLRYNVDMRVFASLFSLPRLVLASRLGYGKIWGDYDFPQAFQLSGPDNLRGYRRDRFAGQSMLFNNTELRFKVADFNTYLFPGSLGLFVFNDVGRVWVKGEDSSDWHVGNGGGIWVAPVRRFVVTAAITRSKEEKMLPLVTFGFQF
jgi:hypothetical protein